MRRATSASRLRTRHRQTARRLCVYAARLVCVGLLGLGVWWAPALAELFPIKEVILQDLEMLSREEVLARVGPVQGTSLMSLNLHDVHHQLLAHPSIEAVVVRRRYPFTLWVRILERHPVVRMLSDRSTLLVDRQGWVMEDRDPRALPVLRGEMLDDYHPGDQVTQPAAIAALGVVRMVATGLPPAQPLLVEAFPRLVRLRWDRYWLLMSADQYREEWERFLAVESDLSRRVQAGEVDLRVPGMVVVRPLMTS